MMTMIMRSEVTGDELNAEKKEINTTSAKARSVPVFRLKLVAFCFSIGVYYSILVFLFNPHKVTLTCISLLAFCLNCIL
jgi:hypothetical protein